MATHLVRQDRVIDDATDDRNIAVERSTVPAGVFAARVVWYITGVIVALLVLRLILQLLGANQGNPFVDLVYGISGFFAWPFFGMFSYTPSYGVSYFEVSTLVAIVIYTLIGWGLANLFLLNRRTTTDAL